MDVAERKLAFLGRLSTSSLWKPSHHGDHYLVLAVRHCGYDDDIMVWRRMTITKPI